MGKTTTLRYTGLVLIRNIYDFDNFIQCSEKVIFSIFKEILITQSFCLKCDELMRTHTISCEKNGFRCTRRKDFKGDKMCRTRYSSRLFNAGFFIAIWRASNVNTFDLSGEESITLALMSSAVATRSLKCKWLPTRAFAYLCSISRVVR